METKGANTQREILSQPQAWSSALKIIGQQKEIISAFFEKSQYSSIYFTGCGSTYYLALAAAGVMQEYSKGFARGLPASEVWLNSSAIKPVGKRNLLVAVSRSGETTETLRACEDFRSRGLGDLLTVSCYPDMPLTKLGDLNLVFPDSQEISLAQTRSFSTIYLACVALALIANGKKEEVQKLDCLPGSCRQLLDQYGSTAMDFGKDPRFERFYFLGSGCRYGLASEISLKMKEMSLSHSEPFHFLEFRHGPKSMVNENTFLLGLVSETNRSHEQKVLEECGDLGARVWTLNGNHGGASFNANLPEPLYSPLYLPLGQLVAYSRAISRGLDPDTPHNVTAVIKLDS